MSLSGKAANTKLRGRIDAGFAAPAKARLEGIAPFGRPVFVLTADGNRGTLVLPREDRVLADAPPDQIVEALAGVPLGPDALRRAVSGCGLSSGEPAGGQRHANNLASVALADSTAFLQQSDGAWKMAGATGGPLTVAYADYANGRPSTIHLRAESGGRRVGRSHAAIVAGGDQHHPRREGLSGGDPGARSAAHSRGPEKGRPARGELRPGMGRSREDDTHVR